MRASFKVSDQERDCYCCIRGPRTAAPTPCEIGVFAYNEAKTIEHCLRSLYCQVTGQVRIKRIWVVVSGSNDGTDELALRAAAENPLVSCVIENERRGKARAINLFLSKTDSELLVISSADLILSPDVVENLLTPMVQDPQVGMTGGRCVPLNEKTGAINRCVHLLWEMHHRLASRDPKLGEVVGIRRELGSLNERVSVDEAYFEYLTVAKGYRPCYVPTALIYNAGPTTLADYFEQRRRIAAGYEHLHRIQCYHRPPTRSVWALVRVAAQVAMTNPRCVATIWLAAVIELAAWFWAWCATRIWGIAPPMWRMVKTAKLSQLSHRRMEGLPSSAHPVHDLGCQQR